ncbi:alpha/beta-hydrolase [Biscogniauxia sp. FL1348]|nr:alpha/beta-hydrolase [Biscogniauxia sp. FL1348]
MQKGRRLGAMPTMPDFPKEAYKLHAKSGTEFSMARPTNTSRWKSWRPAVGAALGLLAISLFLRRFDGAYIVKRILYQFHGRSDDATTRADWDWGSIQSRRTLYWHRCYDDMYDCARLDVPMDWLDPSDSERVILAVIRLRATERDDYRGPVFFNPGGPGGSGVYAMKDRGELLQTVIGKNHDLVSFDPRGTGGTLPRIQCWDTSEKASRWALQDPGVIDAHPGVIHDVFSRATAFSQSCERNMNDSSLLRHISTASHARDMLEILHLMGAEKLKYWGFSYGTILGGVFAAMYPDKVERLVSDGNVDYREWHLDEHINFLRDADKVMAAFYELCHKAGPLGCDFYAETPSLIEQRSADLFEHIRKHPVIIPASEPGPDIPQLIQWSHLRRLTLSTLYRPIEKFKPYAEVLAALEKGDGQPYYKLNTPGGSASSICSVEEIPSDVPRLEEGNDDAFAAITCADHPPSTDTVEQLGEYVDQLKEISSSTGDVNALYKLACIGRTVRPKWRFTGPFEGNTSFPILFVANTADNITPLVSARNNSQGFPGSVILVQNSYGHTSLSAASSCTAGYIYSYFQNGTLPAPGTTCEPDMLPFEETQANIADALTVAVRRLSKSNWLFNPRVY